jgi:hypothetical protein
MLFLSLSASAFKELAISNDEMIPKFQVATACFTCSPPDFELIKIIPLL